MLFISGVSDDKFLVKNTADNVVETHTQSEVLNINKDTPVLGIYEDKEGSLHCGEFKGIDDLHFRFLFVYGKCKEDWSEDNQERMADMLLEMPCSMRLTVDYKAVWGKNEEGSPEYRYIIEHRRSGGWWITDAWYDDVHFEFKFVRSAFVNACKGVSPRFAFEVIM